MEATTQRSHQSSPEELQVWRERGRLLAPGRGAHLPDRGAVSGMSSERVARYSGGAAPALHRFPYPALANQLSIILRSEATKDLLLTQHEIPRHARNDNTGRARRKVYECHAV